MCGRELSCVGCQFPLGFVASGSVCDTRPSERSHVWGLAPLTKAVDVALVSLFQVLLWEAHIVAPILVGASSTITLCRRMGLRVRE